MMAEKNETPQRPPEPPKFQEGRPVNGDNRGQPGFIAGRT